MEAGDGHAGWEGQLNKRSDHVKEWRMRYFRIQARRLYYFDCEEDAAVTAERPHGTHKGWLHLVGASVEPFEEEEEDGTQFWGFEVQEDYGVADDGARVAGDRWRLCTSVDGERAQLLRLLAHARRPAELPKSDPRAARCMASGAEFTMMRRRQVCRRCGGHFAAASTAQRPLPELGYAGKETVCNPCAAGELAGRWEERVPRARRPVKEKPAMQHVGDSVAQGVRRLFGKKPGADAAAPAAAKADSPRSACGKAPLPQQGWMRKEGAPPMGGWKRRWFELRGDELWWYTEQGGAEKGHARVAGAAVADSGTAAHAFTITGPHLPRTYHLSCDKGEERAEWKRRIVAASGAGNK